MTAPQRSPGPRRLVRICLAISLSVAGYTLVQGLLNRSTLGSVWGAATSWVLLVQGLGCLALVLALRRPPATAGALRFGLCVLVLWWLVYVLFLQPYHRFAVEVSLGVAAGFFGLAMLLGQRLAARLPPRFLRIADFTLFTTCMSLLLLEAGLKTVAVIHPSPLFAVTEGTVTDRLRSHAFAPGQIVLGYPCNSRGFYDSEFLPPQERTGRMVAVIGDSFVAGIVPRPWNFTAVAEEHLDGVELYALGYPGLGPDQYLYLLENEALPLRPELVVVCLFAGNDLLEVSTSKGTDRILAQWLDRDCVLLLEVPRRLLAIDQARRVPGGGSETPEQMPWLHDHRLEKPVFRRETYLELVAGRVRPGCVPQPRRLRALFDVLRRMRDAAGDVPLAVVLAPAEFQVEDALWEEIAARLPDVEDLQRDRFQREVGAWLTEQGIPFLDLLPVLRAQPAEPDGDRHLYHLQDSHWNARGNRVTGERVAEFLRTLLTH